MAKSCTRCKLVKPIAEFNRKLDGWQPKCRACCAVIQRRIKYGVSDKKYQKILQRQDGVCAICERPEPRYSHLSVDHNHETDKVRGLLCSNCNPMIGYAKEDPKVLMAAINYLRR